MDQRQTGVHTQNHTDERRTGKSRLRYKNPGQKRRFIKNRHVWGGAMVTLTSITITYNKGAVKAVNDVSFTVETGELFGLIGPDGAGKSSIFRMLTTLLLPDSGTATVDGCDIVKDYQQIRSNVGYMPGRFSLYPDL